MRKLLVVLSVLLLVTPSFAGRADGVIYMTWPGWGDPASKGDVQFADFRVGVDVNMFPNESAAEDALIYLLDVNGQKYSGLGFDYPAPGQTVSCSGVIEYNTDFTLAFSQSNYWNNNIWEKVTITFPDTGVVHYSSLLLGDSRIHLEAGRYNFLSEAGVVPEPGSLAALLTGIIGLVGAAARRRHL